jgi:hypothetical protein
LRLTAGHLTGSGIEEQHAIERIDNQAARLLRAGSQLPSDLLCARP